MAPLEVVWGERYGLCGWRIYYRLKCSKFKEKMFWSQCSLHFVVIPKLLIQPMQIF